MCLQVTENLLVGVSLRPSWDTKLICAAALLRTSELINSIVKYVLPLCAYFTQNCHPSLLSDPAQTQTAHLRPSSHRLRPQDQQNLPHFPTAMQLNQNTALTPQNCLCKGWDMVQPALSKLAPENRKDEKETVLLPSEWLFGDSLSARAGGAQCPPGWQH